MDLKKAAENRQKIIKKMIGNNDQAKNPFYLAAYFQIPFKQAALEIEEILPGNDQFPVFDLDDLTGAVHARNEMMLEKAQKLPKDEVMERFGMWHWPYDTIDTSKIVSTQHIDDKHPLKYAISDYKIDKSVENMAKILECARRRTDRIDTFLYLLQGGVRFHDLQLSVNIQTVVSQSSKALGIKKDFYAKSEIRGAVIDLKETYTLQDIETYTGISTSMASSIETIKKENILSPEQKKKVQEKQDLIKKVWNLYTNGGENHTEGIRQEEIGQMLGLSRHTVSAYLREYKTLHPNEVDHSQLLRPRHMGNEAKKYKEQMYPILAQKYLSFRNSGKNSFEAFELVAQSENTTTYHVRRAAIREGYYVPHHGLSEQKLEQSANFAKEGYLVSQVGLPATKKIMSKELAITTPEGKCDKQSIRLFVEQRQRDSMDMVRVNMDRKKEFLKEGNLKAAMPKEKIKFGKQISALEEELVLE